MDAINCRLNVGMKFDQYRAQVELNQMVHEKGILGKCSKFFMEKWCQY